MSEQMTRRETLKKGLAATSFLAFMSDLAVPAMAQGDEDVPFTDMPKNYNPVPTNPNAPRQLDIRKIEGQLTPREQFFAINHYNRPEIDGAAYRLKFTGMVSKPVEMTLAELRAMKSTDLVN